MGSLIEAAEQLEDEYSTMNIADLPKVDVYEELHEHIGVDKEGKEFKYRYLDRKGVRYRVPYIVIRQIKDIKELSPKLKYVKVKKTGEGKNNTRYTTIPLN